jgi:two-component system sensor histidine kinase KdpD
VRDPWEVVAVAGDFSVDQIGAASVRAAVDDDHTLVLVGRVLTGEDRRLVSAFASRAALILSREVLEEQARRATKLDKDNRARTALLAAVSHDLRTPLASIKAAVSSLRQAEVTFTPEDEASLLETIEESTDSLTGLVANLLDMSRLQSGTVQARQDSVEVADAVVGATRSLSEPERVRTLIDDDTPPVVADAGLLDRVLANILDNALQHSPGRQEVVVRASTTGQQVELRVVDRGMGVPDSAKESIFAPFQRYGDTPKGTGVGLGLAVSKGLVEAMGGSIAAEDTPGGGLTIALVLPRAPATPFEPGAEPAVPADRIAP